MQFIIKEISPSRKEILIAIDSVYSSLSGYDTYTLGTVNGNLDNGTLNPKYISSNNKGYYNSVQVPASLEYSEKIIKFIQNELLNNSNHFEYHRNKENTLIIIILVFLLL